MCKKNDRATAISHPRREGVYAHAANGSAENGNGLFVHFPLFGESSFQFLGSEI